MEDGVVPLVEYGFPRRMFLGEDAREALLQLLSILNPNAVLVVTDKVVGNLERVKEIVSSLRSAGYRVEVFDDVPAEPPIDVADRVAEAASRIGARVFVAIGGGSVIDAAKAGLVRYKRPDVDIRDVAPFNPLGIDPGDTILVAVPTTSGTGSDASHGIVVIDERYGKREKIDVGSLEVIPYATVLDPSLPASAPRRLRIATALDALGHALEALVASQASPLTDALAEKSAAIMLSRLPAALDGDMEASMDVHVAATMAGIAFTNAGLGLIHAIAHPLGARLGVHHGTLVGIVTPHVIEYNYRASPVAAGKYERLRAILEHVYGLTGGGSLADYVRALHDRVGFSARLRDYGVSLGDLEDAARFVAEEAFHDPAIAFAPAIPSPEEVYELVKAMY